LVIFLCPIAVDYASLGRASIGVLLGVILTLPLLAGAFGKRAESRAKHARALVAAAFDRSRALLHTVGPKYVW
jgi:hypothetical protein